MPATASTAADIRFDAAGHRYTLSDGTLVPSVTQILRDTGVSVDFDELAGMSHRVGAAIDLKRDIGVALHADAHAFDDDDLDWATVDPRVDPYLRAWVTFRANTGLKPTTRERRLYHSVYGYAGTLDGIFQRPGGGLVLIDLKTGDPDDSGCAYQTAAYLAAYQHEHGLAPTLVDRWGVQLTPDRQIPYRIYPYTDWTDFGKFQAFVTTFYCQAERRKERR